MMKIVSKAGQFMWLVYGIALRVHGKSYILGKLFFLVMGAKRKLVIVALPMREECVSLRKLLGAPL